MLRRDAGLLLFCSLFTLGASAQEIDFNRDVRPILSNNCLLCHGPDDSGRESGLRLDQAASATQELESGTTAIVPGKPNASALINRITSSDDDLRMPPADHGAPLTKQEIETLTKWVAQGAKFSAHWSYVKPQRASVPDLPASHASWAKNAVDHFTLRQMLQQNLKPLAEADRFALIRRVTLDLTGLPPTLEEAETFARSKDPMAYEKLVDRLLASPAFGEHWARKWLDLARYADSAGYADDPPRTIWGYRDWVIRSFNDNMPFDQFTIEQIAGDMLENPSTSQLVATAFHRNTLTNNEGGTQDEEFRNVAIVDRVNTTMAVWMGTTMACAQCHTHKYDPITQQEYFQLFAILNNTQDADRRDESPRIDVFSDEQLQQKESLLLKVTQLEETLATPTPELAAAQTEWEGRLKGSANWTPAKAAGIKRSSELKSEILESGHILITKPAEKDTYLIDLPGIQKLAALKLTTLPSDSLPGKGAGLAGGNFVITGLRAQFVPQSDAAPKARFVRITNNGNNQILSLAEVEVMSNGKNIATGGKATQHSTAFAGPPELAIDGNTNGDYNAAKSVTHTETVNNPWWELDLGEAKQIENLRIWNRTDNSLHTRLNNFTIQLLDKERQPVWEKTVAEPPNPSAAWSPSNIRDIRFAAAFADYQQPRFAPADVLTGKTGTEDGWAVGGAIPEAHELTLVPAETLQFEEAGTLRVIIEQNSPHTNHLLGQFAFSVTSDAASIERSRLSGEALAVLDKEAGDRSEDEAATLAVWYRTRVAPSLKGPRDSLAAAKKQLASMKPATSVPVLREMAGKGRETRLQFRGNYLDRGNVVERGFPATFHAAPQGDQPDRMTLARWLVSPENPLTARVLANRYWETIFGRGIVVTSEEFGSQGEPPTHPQLLDWLATEVVRTGWDRKALVRLIVTSATYRQSVHASEASLNADPDNRWLSRGPRIRHSAEMIRDQALAVSGLLSRRMYGAPVKPPQPSMGLTAAFGSSTDWKTSGGEDRYRRGLYTTWRRSNPYPSMATFDAPNREVCTVRRNRTNTPLQALVTLNDPVYVEAAQSLARVALKHNENRGIQLTHAFRRCLLRPPTTSEQAALEQLFAESLAELTKQPNEAMQLATDPLGKLPEGMSATEAAAMTIVCNVLLNLDEMFLKR